MIPAMTNETQIVTSQTTRTTMLWLTSATRESPWMVESLQKSRKDLPRFTVLILANKIFEEFTAIFLDVFNCD